MNIIAVDDKCAALWTLEKAIEQAEKNAAVVGFVSAQKALEHAQSTKVDVAFLDIDMPEMDGISLAKALKEAHSKTNIIFVTGYSEYQGEAFSLHASGYVMKPVDQKSVQKELDNLRNPVTKQNTVKTRFQCFGSFAVFVEGEPLMMSRSKTKELLAYLVHKRGASATSAEIASVLWEEREYTHSLQSQTRNTIAALMKILKKAGIADIVQKGWNSLALCTEKVDCDYYEFLKGNAQAVNSYMGEYMKEYSWGEFTIGYLNEKK